MESKISEKQKSAAGNAKIESRKETGNVEHVSRRPEIDW